MDNLEDDEEKDVLIFDTGGLHNGTIKTKSYNVFEYMNHQQEMHVYQDNSKGKFSLIFNAVTKSWIKDRGLPLFLVI